jgi:Asp-tRNA(Asn)/Glu-tRNA(Gln) amidotransferase A subunit family amidase
VLATEPGSEPDPVIARLRIAPRTGSRPLVGLRVAVTDRPSVVDVDADVLDGLQTARRACSRLGAEVVELAAAPGIGPEDSVTILFHELWPYHSQLADHADRYRPSIAEFVDLARRVHDPAAYEAAQARRALVTDGWRAWFADHGGVSLVGPPDAEPLLVQSAIDLQEHELPPPRLGA